MEVSRLCRIERDPTMGYGFSLHGEKGFTGQYVSEVERGGAAEKAGLRCGDRLVEVNNNNVEVMLVYGWGSFVGYSGYSVLIGSVVLVLWCEIPVRLF